MIVSGFELDIAMPETPETPDISETPETPEIPPREEDCVCEFGIAERSDRSSESSRVHF